VFWVISVYFNIRNTLPKYCTFLLGHSVYNNWYVLCFSVDSLGRVGMQLIPPDDGLRMYPKHVEVDLQNKLRINSASGCFLLHRYIEMHGQQNINFEISTFHPTLCYFEFIFIVTFIITPFKGRRVQMNLCLYFPCLGTYFGDISCWRLSVHNDTE
jgi:hypothetical protein